MATSAFAASDLRSNAYTAINQRVPPEFIEKYGKYDSPIQTIDVNVKDLTIVINYVDVERSPCKYISDFILLELFNHIYNFSNFDFRFNSKSDQVDFFERAAFGDRFTAKTKFQRFLSKTPKSFRNTFMIFYERDRIVLRSPRVLSDYRTENFLKELNNLLLNHPYTIVNCHSHNVTQIQVTQL